MEKNIENAVDMGLDNISSQLYIFSIVSGIVLLIIGIVLLITNKGGAKKNITNIGLICIVIGIVAMVSGAIQAI
jgi:uncharacterized membrane protein HdeD (DUF308 family)